jgi:hypothetical protein
MPLNIFTNATVGRVQAVKTVEHFNGGHSFRQDCSPVF